MSLHLWGAPGGAVRPNSALTASTSRLWMVFRRTSSHTSDGASAWSFRVSGSRPDGSAVPSLSSRLCRCRCPRILPPWTVSLWVVGCTDMRESDRVGSWRWRAPGLKGEGARCCMIAGSVRMWLKGDKFIIRHTSQKEKKVDFRASWCWQHYQNKEVSTSMTMSLSGPCVRTSARDTLDMAAPALKTTQAQYFQLKVS